MNSGLYVRAGACATARLAACAISLFGPTTKDSNVLRGFRPGTVVPGFGLLGGSCKTSFSVESGGDAGVPGPDGEQNFTERGLPSAVRIAVCNADIWLLSIQN